VSSPAIPVLPPLSLPPRLRAGDALNWSVQTQLAVGYSVFFVLTAVIGTTPTRITLPTVAVDANGVAAFALASTDTVNYAPGRYQWIAFSVDPSSNRDELAQGVIYIQPNPTASTIPDPRSMNVQILGQITALIAGKALDDVAMYKIGTRELTKIPIDELLRWQAKYEARVRRERIRRGEYVPPNTIGITFGGRGQMR